MYNYLFHSALILCLCLYAESASAQVFKATFMAGANFTQIDGDNDAGYHKVGLHGGIGAMIPLRERLDIGFEILYNELGSKTDNNSPFFFKSSFKYAEIPLIINYVDENKGLIGGGVAYGRAVITDYFDATGPIPLPTTDNYTTNHVSVLGQVGLMFTPNIGVNLRYQYSILPFGTSPNSLFRGQGTFHNVVTARVYIIANGLFQRERRRSNF